MWDSFVNPTARKLMIAFMQLKRLEMHQPPVMGVKPSEVRVLFCIKRAAQSGNADIKVSEISKFLHVTSPSVTQILKGLEAGGLIERHTDPSDRRSVGVKLTTKGDEVTHLAAESMHATFNELSEYLGEEESNRLADLLYKVFRYHHEKAASESSSYWHGD